MRPCSARPRPVRRRTLRSRLLACLAAAAVLCAACSTSRPTGPVVLEDQVDAFTAQISPDGPYRPPTDAERAEVVATIRDLVATRRLTEQAREQLGRRGMALSLATDAAVGREYLLVTSDPRTDRSWALLAIPTDRPPEVLVEVPHPRADQRTEQVGLQVLRATPASIMLEAGAHRRAGDGDADVAHEASSLFQALAVDLSMRFGLTQVELHGFGDRSDFDGDIVISPGQAAAGPPIRAVADALDANGFTLCRAWSDDCPALEGDTNVQGAEAARSGKVFMHIEMNPEIRSDPATVSRFADALAEGLAIS